MISLTAEYALRAVVYLAQQGGARTIQQIAQATQSPGGYLSKVMQELGRSGIVTSQRGLRGGFSLCVSPSELTMYAVVQAVDPDQRASVRSFPTTSEAAETLGLLRRQLDTVNATMEKLFRDCTIAQLLVSPPPPSTESGTDSSAPLMPPIPAPA